MDWSLIPVGQQGTEYLRSAFESGMSMGREALRHVEFSEGDCVALVPAGAPEELIYDFAHGGLGSSRATIAALAALVQEWQIAGGGVFIAENAMAKPSDPPRSEDPAQRFSFGDEVYEYLQAERVSVGRVEALIRLADAGYSMNALLSRADLAGELPEYLVPIESDRLRLLAAGAVLLVARAYDGEGFVLWLR